MRALKVFGLSTLAVALGMIASRDAVAIPVLQLYIEGATYDAGSESWVFTSTGPLRLWTIGNVDGPGGPHATIEDVKLSVAYADGVTPTISLTPSTTGGYAGFTDPSTPGAASFIQTKTDGSSPLLGDGSSLPSHGIYGLGTDWQEFFLGDFSLEDSPIGDFISSVPSPGALAAQINVYEVSVTGVAEGTELHFDLYNHVGGGNHIKYKFAPFSHDGEGDGGDGGGGGGGGGEVPEPASVLVWALLGIVGVVVARRRRA